ncbi:MAG: OmpA family protein [candidate division WOR-3 bacterium]
MKKLLTLLFIFAPLFLFSYTGMGGGRGHFFVQDALTQGPGFLTLSLHTLSRRQKPETSFFYTDMLLALTYSPIDYFEASLSGGGIFLDYPFENFASSWHDWTLKGKLTFPLIKVFKPGFILGYNFPRDTVYDTLGLAVKKGLEYTGAVNLKFSDLFPPLPSLLFNFGRYKDELDSGHTYFGASLELAARSLLFFGEYHKVGELTRLTPGIKIFSPSLSFDFGWSFLFLPNKERRNQLSIGFTYLTPFLRVTTPTGRIVGKVFSATTHQPIPATISFPENPKLKPIANDPTTGLYEATKIPEGTIVVEVFSEGYFKEYLPVTVKKDMTITQDFYLKPVKVFGQLAGRVYEANTGKPLAARLSFPNTDLPPIFSDSLTGAFRLSEVPTGVLVVEAEKEGYFKHSVSATIRENELTSLEIPLSPSLFVSVVTGKVSDKKTGEGIAAEIIFEGAAIPPVRTDPKTGIYRAELPVGTYTAVVKAENYITQTLPVIVEKDKVTEKNFSLVSVGMTITLKVLFDFNKATIRPESYRLLDEAAQILKDNPKIKVEIQGHTDNIGSDAYNQKLSERRAQAVANYFISQHGIDEKRLRVVGYGETKPIASNETEEGRALNRRVEFVVLSEE